MERSQSRISLSASFEALAIYFPCMNSFDEDDGGPRRETGPHVIIPGEEKILLEDPSRNGQSAAEEKSLVDVVYALRDEVQELKQDNKKMKRSLEEEQRARKDLEKIVKRVLKSMNDPTWDETNL